MNKKCTFVSWKWGPFFLMKENPISSIKLEQRLSKLFSPLHVKNSRFFLSYFLKKKKMIGPRHTPAQGIHRPKAADSPLGMCMLKKILTIKRILKMNRSSSWNSLHKLQSFQLCLVYSFVRIYTVVQILGDFGFLNLSTLQLPYIFITEQTNFFAYT